MRETEEAQLATARTHAGQHDASHLDCDATSIPCSGGEADQQHATCRDGGQEPDADMIRHEMDVVRCGEFDYHAGDYIGQEDSAFRDIRADKVQGGC